MWKSWISITVTKTLPVGHRSRLANVVAETRGQMDEVVTHGREGKSPGRTDEELGIHALRGGDVVGITPYFYSGRRAPEFTHRGIARSLRVELFGAARWVVHQPPGCIPWRRGRLARN